MSKKRKKTGLEPAIPKRKNPTKTEQSNFPIFSFRFIHKDYCLEQCSNEEKKMLIEQIVKISKLS